MNPYPGLRPFADDDGPYFYGRDSEIEQLLSLLAVSRFVVVNGVSGSGKSSLVQAGVIPILRSGFANELAADWTIVRLWPSQGPLEQLRKILELPEVFSTPSDLLSFARQKLVHGRRLLVIVDQFEEIFDYRRAKQAIDGGNECALFVNLLLAATDQRDTPVSVILTMRSDYLGECSQFRGLAEALNRGHYLVPRLTRLQQEEAVTGPAASFSVEFEPTLVQRLLNDSEDNPDRLPVLQHILKRLWEEKGGRAIITSNDYDEVGGWGRALENDAGGVLKQFSDEERSGGIARLFQWVTSTNAAGQPVRRPVSFSALATVTGLKTDRLREVILAFQQRGLLRDSGADDDSLIDLAHESVALQWKWLRDLIDKEVESAARLRFIRESAKDSNRLSGLALQEALKLKQRMSEFPSWRDRYLDAASSKEITAWIDTSQEMEQVDRQREARELAKWSAESLKDDPERSLILAMYSWGKRRAMAPGLEQILHDAVLRSPVRASLYGHQDAVFAVAWSPDGSRLATASADGTAKVWVAESGRELLTLSGPLAPQYDVAWSPDGHRLATASRDGTAKVWEVRRGQELLTLSGHQDFVRVVAWSADGTRLATASADNTAKVWELADGQELLTLRGHRGFVLSISWSPDGKRLATAGEDKTARVWEAGTGREIQTLCGHRSPVYDIAWSPDGNQLATASGDKTAKVWEAAGGQELLTLGGHRDVVWSVAWFPDGGRLATASGDNTAKVWETTTGRELQTLRSHQYAVRSVAWSPDGSRLATASGDKTAKVWEARRGQELLILRGHQGPVGSVAWSPDGNRLATASGDKTAKVWEARSGAELQTVSGHQGFVLCVAWSPDGNLLATASSDKTAKVWEPENGHQRLILNGHRAPVVSIAWSPDGSRLATASLDHTVKVWEAGSGEELQTLDHRDTVYCIAWSPNGKRVATASADNIARVWKIGTEWKPLHLRGHRGPVRSISWSPDGKRLATAGEDKTAKVWEAQGRELQTLRGHRSAVYSVSWSPDGKRLATASRDGTAKVWEAERGHELLILRGHHDPVRSIAWSPDGKSVASAGEDRTVQVYAIDENELLRLVRSRITRDLTPGECKRYFGAVRCPLLPDTP